MKKNLIIAPHPDDEIIGCWSVMVEPNVHNQVCYFNIETERRRQEAYRSSNKLEFYIRPERPEQINNFHLFDRIYVPSKHDLHPDHRECHSLFKHKATHFYSTDKNTQYIKLLDREQREAKLKHLKKCYPSQKSVWGANDKYVLFEDIRDWEDETFINVNLRVEGFHKYDKAPDNVDFLRSLHRHMFHINVCIQVFHDDREIEFITFKRWLEREIKEKFDLHSLGSCEMFAKSIYELICKKKYSIQRKMKIEVSEDGENGAIVEF